MPAARVVPIPPVEITYVRPGPAAYAWLEETVAQLKSTDPLSPVTVVVPNLPAGQALRRHLARRGGAANVRTMRIADVALHLLGPDAGGLRALDSVLELSAVRAAARLSAEQRGGTFQGLVEQPALHRSLARLYRELRRQEPDVTRLLAGDIAHEGDDGGDIRREALESYRCFETLTANLVDQTDLRKRATAKLQGCNVMPATLRELGTIVLFLPPRIDPADAALFAVAGKLGTPVVAALARLDDPLDLADEPGKQAAALLAAAFGCTAPVAPEAPAALRVAVLVTIVRAPDAAEEVREAVRRIVADLERPEGVVPLHEVAVLYRDMETYGPLVREALTLAELPWVSLHGRSLLESRPGRALLALLRLPARQFARTAVLEWLVSVPAPPVADGVTPVAAGTWDRISRAAHVVRGAAQWASRLAAYALEEEQLAARRAADELPASQARASAARQMAQVVQALHRDLAPPPAGSPWSAFVDWAERLRVRYAGGTPEPADASEAEPVEATEESAPEPVAWPEHEQPFAERVREALDSLKQADTFEGETGTTLRQFLGTLEGVLEQHTVTQGHLGEGVVFGPVQAIGGLTFERVYLLGMAEGAFPPTPGPDPFFPEALTGETAELTEESSRGRWTDRRTLQRIAERTAFLTALAAADGGRLVLSTPAAYGGRAAFPSRWLLEVAATCVEAAAAAGAAIAAASAGDETRTRRRRPLHNERFSALREDENAWLRVIPSAQNGTERAPSAADLEDRRLAEAAAWRRAGRPLSGHPLARRSDLPLGRAVEVVAARASAAFSPYDGNTKELAANAPRVRQLLQGERPVTATRVETWATCPYKYFLFYVIGVEPTERPEEIWTIDARDRGGLTHRVLDAFMREMVAATRISDGGAYTDADRQRLHQIAEAEFAMAHSRGETGHPLVWETSKRTILEDLYTFLTEDEVWRRESGFTPRYFEQAFGMGGPGAWPEVVVALPTHGTAAAGKGQVRMRFRGLIDRVDVDPSGWSAQVFDYKTGSVDAYRKLQADAVLAGKHVQLAVYARAAQAHLERQAAAGGGDVKVKGAFWFATKKAGQRRIQMPDDELAVQRRLEEALGVVAEGIGVGAFPQVPGDESQGSWEHCRHCDFDRVCPSARDDAWERKQQAEGASLYLRLQASPPTPLPMGEGS
jgi:ATP-dependent helicase/nuclease subunit B